MKLNYDPQKMPCPDCGTRDRHIHSFMCWNHPSPYVYGTTLEPIARKDGKPLDKRRYPDPAE